MPSPKRNGTPLAGPNLLVLHCLFFFCPGALFLPSLEILSDHFSSPRPLSLCFSWQWLLLFVSAELLNLLLDTDKGDGRESPHHCIRQAVLLLSGRVPGSTTHTCLPVESSRSKHRTEYRSGAVNALVGPVADCSVISDFGYPSSLCRSTKKARSGHGKALFVLVNYCQVLRILRYQ